MSVSKARRHQSIDALQCCAPARTDAIEWGDFLEERPLADARSPIDVFYESQKLLVRAATVLATEGIDAEVQGLLAGQLFLGYISATELYLRQTFATMVQICPLVRRINADQTLTFGAIDYYGNKAVELALTEQVSFTEVGKVRAHLKNRLGMDTQGNSSLERAIDDFETVCQLRHALVHSHGRMNSRNVTKFFAGASSGERQVRFDAKALDDAASVSVNLVREINLEVLKHVVWVWIQEGEVGVNRRRTRSRLSKLFKAVASEHDRVRGLFAETEQSLTDSVMGVISSVSK